MTFEHSKVIHTIDRVLLPSSYAEEDGTELPSIIDDVKTEEAARQSIPAVLMENGLTTLVELGAKAGLVEVLSSPGQ